MSEESKEKQERAPSARSPEAVDLSMRLFPAGYEREHAEAILAAALLSAESRGRERGIEEALSAADVFRCGCEFHPCSHDEVARALRGHLLRALAGNADPKGTPPSPSREDLLGALRAARRLLLTTKGPLVASRGTTVADLASRRRGAWAEILSIIDAALASAASATKSPPSPPVVQENQQGAAAPRSPRLGVALLVTDRSGRVLFGRRGKEPNRGKWVLPGGGVHFGEHWREAGERELREETGLAVEVIEDEEPHFVEIIGEDEHRIILTARANVIGGVQHAGSDLLEVGFFDARSWPELSPVALEMLTWFGFFSEQPPAGPSEPAAAALPEEK